MSQKTVLMVEGKDDEHVVKHICGLRRLGDIGTIKDYGGVESLMEAIGPRLKESDIASLGILVDADVDVSARWDAICHRLRTAGYVDIPAIPDKAGTIINPPPGTLLPKVGVWLMPDNVLSGILEDFLAFLVDGDDPLLAHVEASLQNIPHGHCRFSVLTRPKAKIHTWLAWQDEPGRPFGQAITLKYLDVTRPSVDIFANWLNRVFFSSMEAVA